MAAPSFWGSFAKTLPMMLLFGIVGPIFLVGYFLFDDPAVGWMLWWGLIVTVLDVALAVGVSLAAYRREQKLLRLASTGRIAQADIVAMEETGVLVNDQPVLKLHLRIHSTDVAPFEVLDKKIVPTMAVPLLHRGSLAVQVDPETQEYEIDWAATAQLTGANEAPAPLGTPAERLAALDDLMKKDLLSPEEYADSRKRILGEL